MGDCKRACQLFTNVILLASSEQDLARHLDVEHGQVITLLFRARARPLTPEKYTESEKFPTLCSALMCVYLKRERDQVRES